MKKLLLFALCAFMFAACEPVEGPATPQGKLTLTSKAVMNFETVGGTGEITFDFVADETRQGAPVTVTCTEDWITDIKVGERNVTFTVASNDGNERSATIKLSAGQDNNAHVMVMQAGAPTFDVNFTATHLAGTYWGKFPSTKGFNYLVILGDMPAEHYLSKLEGATEYRFNIYSNVASSFNTTHRVPVGTYTLDHQSTGNPGTIDASRDQSFLFAANDADIPYSAATMVVTEDSITVEITFMNGDTHRVEYHGSTVYEDYIENTFADVYPVSQYTEDITFDIKNGRINLYYRGDHLGTGCDVWLCEMIQETNPYNGVYMLFDLIIPKGLGGTNNTDSIVGEYKFHDENTTSYEYTIPVGRLRDDSLQMHAWYLYCIQSQIDMSQAAPMTSGSVIVTKNAIQDYTFVIDSTDDNGNRIYGTFQGTLLNLYDQFNE